MANRHFGRIGDIWKHLPLAEFLVIEKPKRYVETHAGNALYDLTPSPERDYGVYAYLRGCSTNTSLRSAAYSKILDECVTEDHQHRYPGSPYLAMKLLQPGAHFDLYDLDPESIANLSAAAQGSGHSHVNIVQTDGLDATLGILRDTSSGHEGLLAHIDPYDPYAVGTSGVNSLELLVLVSKVGAKCVYWYGFDTLSERLRLFEAFKKISKEASRKFYVHEIRLVTLLSPDYEFNPGVRGGCGIICANLSDQSMARCTELARALEEVYKDVKLPGNRSGAIQYLQERY